MFCATQICSTLAHDYDNTVQNFLNLTNKMQYVVFNDHESDITEIYDGVQQRLILGPFFYFLVVFSFIKEKLPIVVVRDVCPSVRLSVRPSVCINNYFFCGNLTSNRQIDHKIGLNVRYRVVHVRKA